MLTYLHVKNLALIDEAEVEFGPGLNILTGETGAGKSILMGSVNLALGQKMSREMLRDEEKPALVELIFQVDNPGCVERLKEKEISVEEGQIIISRKLTGNRSISRLNGEVCTAAQIREISSLLLDIHGQHEHQSLLYQDQQLKILDAYGKEAIQEKKQTVREHFQIWSQKKKELTSYQLDEETRKREISFLAFELQEIEEAGLRRARMKNWKNSTKRCHRAEISSKRWQQSEAIQATTTAHRIWSAGPYRRQTGCLESMKRCSRLQAFYRMWKVCYLM